MAKITRTTYFWQHKTPEGKVRLAQRANIGQQTRGDSANVVDDRAAGTFLHIDRLSLWLRTLFEQNARSLATPATNFVQAKSSTAHEKTEL